MSAIISRPTIGFPCNSPFINVPVTPTLQPIGGVVIVNAGATVVVDAIPVSDYRGTKWFVSVVNHHNGNVEMYEIFGVHQNGINPSHTLYSIQGNGVNHIQDVTIAGGNLQLEITNNEANEIIVYLTRVPLPRVNVPTVPLPANFAPMNVVQIHDTTVPASKTVTIDTVPFRFNKAEKWLLTLLDLTNGNIEAQEVYGIHGLAQFTINEYAIVGLLGILATVDVVATGTKVALRITNNETNDIAVAGSRVAVTLDNLMSAPPPTTSCVENPCVPEIECDILLAFATSITINPGQTLVVDQVNHVGYLQVKWLLAASHDSTNETSGFQVNMLTHYGNPDFVLYSQVGTLLNLSTDVVTVGLNINLQITNNEAFPVTIDIVREPVSV